MENINSLYEVIEGLNKSKDYAKLDIFLIECIEKRNILDEKLFNFYVNNAKNLGDKILELSRLNQLTSCFPMNLSYLVRTGFLANRVSDFKLAEKCSEILINDYPEDHRGLELQARIAENRADVLLAYKYWQTACSKFSNNLFINYFASLFFLKNKYFADLRNSLSSLQKLQPDDCKTVEVEAKFFTAINHNNEAVNSWKKLLAQKITPVFLKDYIRFCLKCNFITEAEEASIQLILVNPTDHSGYEFYAKIAEKLEDYEKALTRYNDGLKKLPNNFFLILHKGFLQSFLLSYSDALISASNLIEINPNDIRSWQLRGRVFQDMNDYEQSLATWMEAARHCPDNRDISIQLAHNLKKLGLTKSTYHYIEAIISSEKNNTWDLIHLYPYMDAILRKEVSNILKQPHEHIGLKRNLEAIKLLRILKKYRLSSKLINYVKNTNNIDDKLPRFTVDNSFKLIVNNSKNCPLIITFQGFVGELTREYYKKNKLNNLELLNNDDLEFSFTGLANRNKQYNYLLVKDNYQTWYQLNTSKYLEYIFSVINQLKPTKTACVGMSSGGFAAILFGQLIKANCVFALCPQTIAFTSYTTNYREALEEKYLLSLSDNSDLGKIQKNSAGFIPDVYIYLCKDSVVDLNALHHLDLKDKKLNILYQQGNMHGVADVIGKSKLFKDIVDTIDR